MNKFNCNELWQYNEWPEVELERNIINKKVRSKKLTETVTKINKSLNEGTLLINQSNQPLETIADNLEALGYTVDKFPLKGFEDEVAFIAHKTTPAQRRICDCDIETTIGGYINTSSCEVSVQLDDTNDIAFMNNQQIEALCARLKTVLQQAESDLQKAIPEKI